MNGKKTWSKAVISTVLAIVMVLSLGAYAIAGTISVDGHDTGYNADSEAHGQYTLNGPISSGDREAYDAGANKAAGGNVTTKDGVTIDKVADYDSVAGTGTITLTVDATKPTTFEYFPSPRMDYVLVVDITTSMTQPLRDDPILKTKESSWEMFWDDRTRIYQTREAIKEAAELIWEANEGSTITVVPFAEGTMIPNRNGNGFTYKDFIPSTSSFKTTNPATDAETIGHIHIPSDVDLADPTNFSDLAKNKALTNRYSYYKVTKANGGDDFAKSIDVLPLASGTYTAAGVQAAKDIFESGDLAATDKENRILFVITDGGANITPRDGSITNWHYATVYYPAAARLTGEACAEVKDPSKGNATVSVISLSPVPIMIKGEEPYLNGTDGTYAYYTSYDRKGTIAWTKATENLPGGQPYTAPTDLQMLFDVQNGEYGMCTNWATSPAHYYGSEDTGEAVFNVIKNSIRESVQLFSGSQVNLSDALNTNVFEMDMSVEPVVKVSLNSSPEIDSTDPSFPSEIVVTRTANGVTANLGTMPYGQALAAASSSKVTITYSFKLKDAVGAHYADLHTNIDDETYLQVTSPKHTTATTTDISYTADPFYMPFPTPVVTLDGDNDAPHVTLQKLNENGAFLNGATFSVTRTDGTPTGSLSVSPVNAAGEEFVVEKGATYKISEKATPSGYKTLSGDIEMTVGADGTPSITSDSSGAAALDVTSSSGDPVRATLKITNQPTTGGGEGEDGEFKKVPTVTNARPGQTVSYIIQGIGNTKSKPVTNYAITDLPPKGLDFVSVDLPAFTKGAGLTYSVKYRTNQRGNTTLKSGLTADTARTVTAPSLNTNEFITAVSICFDQVPVGFGVGDTIKISFKIWDKPPTGSLTNKAGLSYTLDGDDINIVDPGTPIDTGTGGGGGNSGGGNGGGGGTSNRNGSGSNASTGDSMNTSIIFIALAACVVIVGTGSSQYLRRKRKASQDS